MIESLGEIWVESTLKKKRFTEWKNLINLWIPQKSNTTDFRSTGYIDEVLLEIGFVSCLRKTGIWSISTRVAADLSCAVEKV